MEPRRFTITRDEVVIAYGVQFEGGRIVLQYVSGEEYTNPRPVSDFDWLYQTLQVDETSVTWIDE